ncbi:Plasmid and phage DNA primase [Yersinia mollaretii ATCC 43969]|uniref:Plasmid and phage DNA primase n=1 Tax=Yersinia mollaretii (strain ATCC 43969 / DSM 18520 / CIP 103324 / CNY 7263 / WAIP 204) TaxID=349967 RepID=A0ABM9Y618_YERMW|nr:Plasmid and phage DNA primase [Yersinia mollaretii ATCC 43969]
MVSRVRQCGIIQAAREISRLIGLTPTAPAREKTGFCCSPDMMQKVEVLLATCSRGSSDYLLCKGLDQPVL